MFTICLLTTLTLVAEPTREAVKIETKTGTLHGTLDLPTGSGPWPLVVIHAGSGPTDRDGNSAVPGVKPGNLKMIGVALADKGIACLRFDKRGIAGSAKAMVKEEDLRIMQFADDVLAWAKWLRTDKRFTQVGFIGHSEGSIIGCLAKDAKFDAFVSLCGPGRKFSDLIREQTKTKLPKALAEANTAILESLDAGKTVKDVPKELLGLYRPSIQPYIISVIQVDPVKALGELSCPVLVVSGTSDIQISEADYKALTAVKGVKAVQVNEMNHVLKEVKGTNQLLQLASYANPDLPLHPKLPGALVEFFQASFKK